MSDPSPIPAHLDPFISEAIEKGLRDPEQILHYAIERENELLMELYDPQTERAHALIRGLSAIVYDAIRAGA